MSLSRATWLVARREFSERIHSRAFQISMLITVLVVAAVGIIAGVVNDDGRSEYTVGAVGPEGQVVAAAARSLGPAFDVDIEVQRERSAAAARAAVRHESVDAAVVEGVIVSLKEPPDELEQALQAAARRLRSGTALRSEGASGAEARRVLDPPPLRTWRSRGRTRAGRASPSSRRSCSTSSSSRMA